MFLLLGVLLWHTYTKRIDTLKLSTEKHTHTQLIAHLQTSSLLVWTWMADHALDVNIAIRMRSVEFIESEQSRQYIA